MSFYTDVIRRDSRYSMTTTIADAALLEPGTRKAVANFIAAAKAGGHDVRLGETYRSQPRQRMLYGKGLTQLRNVGCHGYGVAADLQLWIGPDGHKAYDPHGEHYAFFEALAVKVGLISGIHWGTPKAHHSFTDWCHVQRVPVFRQTALFAGTWYPPEVYDPYLDMRDHHIPGIAA